MSNKFGIFLRAAYNYDVDAASNDSALSEFEESRTVQSEADDCDINVIMKRFGQGLPLPITAKVPLQTEWDDIHTFQDAMDITNAGRSAFMQLDADTRARFANDPAKFLEFFYDPKNKDEAIKLGFIMEPAPEPEQVSPAPVSE